MFEKGGLLFHRETGETAGDGERGCAPLSTDMEVVAGDAVKVPRGGEKTDPDRVDDRGLTAVILPDQDVRPTIELKVQTTISTAFLLGGWPEDAEILSTHAGQIQCSSPVTRPALWPAQASATAPQHAAPG